jgi:hypothetical protein
MRERNQDHAHIPPPDPQRQKRVLGIKTHHLIGALFLIAILLVYLLLQARRGVFVPTKQHAVPTSSYTSHPDPQLT